MGATVSRHLHALVLLALLLLALPCFAARAAPPSSPIVITYAEQAARIARDTSLYRAGRGVALREDDLLESGSGALQFDAGGASFALGPASRIFIDKGGEIVLLEGWLKLRGLPARPLAAATAHLRLASSGSTVILHAGAAASELFAEAGEVVVHETGTGKRRPGASVPHEHFAVRAGILPLRLAERAPPDFLAAMPRGFRDELVPLALNGPATQPRRERGARFAELAPWVNGHPLLRQRLQARFEPPPSPRPARPAPALPSTIQ